jgi:hypothetical protein
MAATVHSHAASTGKQAGGRIVQLRTGKVDRMAALGPVRIGRALTFPEFAFIRSDSRIKTLRKRVGLPE